MTYKCSWSCFTSLTAIFSHWSNLDYCFQIFTVLLSFSNRMTYWYPHHIWTPLLECGLGLKTCFGPMGRHNGKAIYLPLDDTVSSVPWWLPLQLGSQKENVAFGREVSPSGKTSSFKTHEWEQMQPVILQWGLEWFTTWCDNKYYPYI